MKRTYQPNKRRRAKKHGFFARIKGKVLNKRRAKKRKKLCAKNRPQQVAFFVFILTKNCLIYIIRMEVNYEKERDNKKKFRLYQCN